MAQCANCNATIIFGGHQVGEYRFCSSRCVMMARPSLAAGELAGGVADDLGQLRDDIVLIADDLQQQQTVQAELNERVDFLERTLAQLREEMRNRGRSPSHG